MHYRSEWFPRIIMCRFASECLLSRHLFFRSMHHKKLLDPGFVISSINKVRVIKLIPLDPEWGFCKGYSLCKMADFETTLIYPKFSVLSSGFCTQHRQMGCRKDFDTFFGISIFDPKRGFSKAIAFAWWPISKMLSFLKYLLFSQAVFCIEQLQMTCKINFYTFFGTLIFDPSEDSAKAIAFA